MLKFVGVIYGIGFCLLLTGCASHGPWKERGRTPPDTTRTLNLPDVEGVATTLPQFAIKKNEVSIANSFNDVDPSWVIGSLVNTKTGDVHGFDNFLMTDAKLTVSPQSEIVFKNFIENSAAANTSWLDFVEMKLSDSTRAEVIITKNSKVTTDNKSIDRAKLISELNKLSASERADYGVIIGFVDYLLAAAYFRNVGAEGAASGYGAKIGGTWFSRSEYSGVHHRIVAIWSPLPFVLDASNLTQTIDLSQATSEAIGKGKISIQKLESEIHIQK